MKVGLREWICRCMRKGERDCKVDDVIVEENYDFCVSVLSLVL